MREYKVKTQSFCHWCDYPCRKGHKCSVYKKFAKSKKERNKINKKLLGGYEDEC